MRPRSLFAAMLMLGTVACSQGTNPAAPSATATAPSISMIPGEGTNASNGASGSSEALLAAVRQATAKYHDVSKAIADGYAPPVAAACTEIPGVGAMGVHSLNMGLAMDQTVDPLKPELLLYEPKKSGGFNLVGVEYFVPQVPTPVASAPMLFGQTFNGPMEGHEPGMPEHYDLHVWIWQPNPNGMFAQWNPNVSCADAQ